MQSQLLARPSTARSNRKASTLTTESTTPDIISNPVEFVITNPYKDLVLSGVAARAKASKTKMRICNTGWLDIYTVSSTSRPDVWHKVWISRPDAKGNRTVSCTCEANVLCKHIAAVYPYHIWRMTQRWQAEEDERAARAATLDCSQHPDVKAVTLDKVDGPLCQDCVNDKEECQLEGFKAPSGPLPAPATNPGDGGVECQRCHKVVPADDICRNGLCIRCNDSDLFGF